MRNNQGNAGRSEMGLCCHWRAVLLQNSSPEVLGKAWQADIVTVKEGVQRVVDVPAHSTLQHASVTAPRYIWHVFRHKHSLDIKCGKFKYNHNGI